MIKNLKSLKKSTSKASKKLWKNDIMAKIMDKEKWLTAKERLVQVYKNPKAKDRRGWYIILYLTIATTITSISLYTFLTYQLNIYHQTFQLLDSYDNGAYFSSVKSQLTTLTLTNIIGMMVLNQSIKRIRRGRMRWMIYTFTGWSLMWAVTFITTSVQTGSLLVSRHNLFRVC